MAALPLRLLGRLGGVGRRGRLPPPLAALPHLSVPSHQSPDRQIPSPAPPLPFPTLVLPFAVPARSFSWYSRSPSGPTTAAAEAHVDEDARNETESVCLDDVSATHYGEGLAGAADAAVVVADGGDGGGMTDLAMGALVDVLDGFHSLTGLPWWITISFSTVAMRLSILPVLMLQLQKTAKIGQLFRQLPPPLPPPLSGRSFRDQYSLFQKKRRELGCPSFLWNLAYFSVQHLKAHSTPTSPALSCYRLSTQGGVLWFHNLTEFSHGALGPVFPILVAGLHYLNMQISFQTSQTKHYPGVLALLAKYYKMYLDILSIPLFLIAYVVPQGCLIYWTTNGLFTVAQQLYLRPGVIRKMFGLPDIGARAGNTAFRSPLEGQEMIQRWPRGEFRMQSRLGSSDNGTTSENMTPKFMFESSTLMEGDVSEASTPEDLLEQALQHLENGCQDQAIPLIRTAIEKNPDLSTSLIAMAQTFYSKMLFSEASLCYEHAIPQMKEQDPLIVLAHFGAGLSCRKQGDNEAAIEHLQRLAELKEPELMMNKACYFRGIIVLGSILSNEGRKSEAAKYLRLALAYDPAAERLLKECEEAVEDQPKSAEH